MQLGSTWTKKSITALIVQVSAVAAMYNHLVNSPNIWADRNRPDAKACNLIEAVKGSDHGRCNSHSSVRAYMWGMVVQCSTPLLGNV